MDWSVLLTLIGFCRLSGHTILQLFQNYSGLCRTFKLVDWWVLQAQVGFAGFGLQTPIVDDTKQCLAIVKLFWQNNERSE